MPGFFIARAIAILLFLLILYFGVSSLQSGETRSRGYKFTRDENPIGYWFTVLISLAGPIAIIYLLVTR